MSTGAHRGQKMVWDPDSLALKLQAAVSCAMWVLGTKLYPLA